MKKFYSYSFTAFTTLFVWAQTGQAQCVNGTPGGTTAYDTTMKFPTGATNMQVKFPKFNAQAGMVTCVKLIVTVVGIVDTVAMQNYSGSPQTADFYYNRSDFMSGPGLTPSLSNTFNGHYGPYGLSAYDGIPNAGSDFQSISRDTVLRQSMTRTLTDSTEISQFYGPPGDSVNYNYNINVSTSATITGGSSSSLVLTSALVNFRFEYCTCPLSVLPVGLKNFSVSKTGTANAGLRWEAEAGTDHYFYEIEVSRDGQHFSKEAVMNKQVNAASPLYQFAYAAKPHEYGRYYFRVKQQWLDGYYRYSEVRSVDFANALFASVSVYPNPSSGQAGIKFIAAKAGVYKVEVSNAAGQGISNKEMQVAETDFKQLNTLQKGTYYVKITELTSGASCIQQLIVQ